MTDQPTPPPERPLPDEARARIRGDLLAHALERRSRAPRWAVPAGAAAAVALVVGLGYSVVSAGDSGEPGVPVTGGGTSSGSPTPPTPSGGPSTEGTATATVVGPETAYTTSPPEGGVQVGKGTCETELANVLKGATDVFETSDISFWVGGDRFSVCQAGSDLTTLTRPLPLAPRDGVQTFRVAGIPAQHSGADDLFVAGGVVPDGATAFSVEYAFPDGQTVPAQTGTDATGRSWWWVEHASPAYRGNITRLPPIEVTVSYSGVQKQYSLEWGTDTCAQANHGC